MINITNHDLFFFLVLKRFINPNSQREKSIGSTTKTSKIEWTWILKSSFHHWVILPDQAICALWYRKGKKMPQQLLSGGPLFKAVKKATHSPQKYNIEFTDDWNSASSTTIFFPVVCTVNSLVLILHWLLKEMYKNLRSLTTAGIISQMFDVLVFGPVERLNLSRAGIFKYFWVNTTTSFLLVYWKFPFFTET